MKSFGCVLATTFLIGLTAGCDSKPTVSENETRQIFIEQRLNNSVTQGNHTYIPFIVRHPSKHIKDILEILNRFEKQHPDLKITHWHLDTGMYTTHGLWIDHEPRRN